MLRSRRARRQLTPQNLPASTHRESTADVYAVESYKEAERRLDVIEKRLQDLLAFIVTITVGLIGICAGKLTFNTPSFILAMLCAFAAIGLGIYTRLTGRLILISPKRLYDIFLVATDTQFKLWFLGSAGENSDLNAYSIQRKANLTGWIAIVFLAECVLLGFWAAGQAPPASSQGSVVGSLAGAAVGQARKAR